MCFANEAIDSVGEKKSGVSGFMCKLDIENSYDHLNWNCYASL